MNYLPALNPIVKVWDNPLCTFGAEVVPLYEYQATPWLCMRDLIPHECGRAVLIVNGQALLQKDWYRPVLPGDVIEWHILAGGRNASRTILTIVAMIAIAYFTAGIVNPFYAAAFSVAASLAATALINALIPLKTADASSGAVSPGSVYNTSLAGNQARLNQPIPVIYGRMKVFPDFAAQPYAYYRNNDQFYCALLCIGQGDYAIENLLIDTTPISSFKSVFYKVLPPGTAPTRVSGNTVTAIVVAGNTLDASKPIGGFAICKPRSQVNSLSWDLLCDQGLVKFNDDGSASNFSITVSVDIQYIDDFGVALGDYIRLASSTMTAQSRTPQRQTFSAALSPPGRVQVRLTRETPFSDDNKTINVIAWGGLRGRLTVPAPLAASATYIEIIMRANEQLNGISQKKVNLIARRKLPTYDLSSGLWTIPIETRNPMWAVADVWRNTVYGDSRLDSEIDLVTLAVLAETYRVRQDNLDIVFDSRVTSKDASRTICQVGRAIPTQRMGVFSVVRDEYRPTPVTAFTTRDIIPGSTSIGYAMVTPETADSIIYEYFDNRSWDWTPVQVNVPGVTSPVRPLTIRVQGITGSFHAKREAYYLAAVNLYRRKFPKWQTEMKGILAPYGSPVVFSPALPNWGTPGDLVNWDASTLTAYLSEPVTFVPGFAHYITLEKQNGSLSIAIPVTPGPVANSVQLSQAPGFTPTTSDSDIERTKFVFGPEGSHRVMVRLTHAVSKGRSAEGNPLVELSGVAENNLVHTADNPFLPVGAKIQDPVPLTTVDTASLPINDPDNPNADPGLPRVVLNPHTISMGNWGSPDDTYTGGGGAFKIFRDGTAGYGIYADALSAAAYLESSSGLYPGEWFNRTPDAGATSAYEIYVSASSNFISASPIGIIGAGAGSPYNTWLNLGVQDYSWNYWANLLNSQLFTNNAVGGSFAVGMSVTLQIKIRRVGGSVPLVDTTFVIAPNIFGNDIGSAGTGGG